MQVVVHFLHEDAEGSTVSEKEPPREEEKRRMYTEIKRLGGVPTLFVNGEPVYANAYVSYLDDRARYEDFAAAGIRIYSVPVYLAGRGINTDSNIGPFRTGLWDCEKELNFSPLEDDLRQVLAANPEALIFPRIDLDMPEWWDEKCPNELNRLANGVKLRQSFVSERWREDAGVALTKIICYLEQSEYRRHIIGYQIAAGGTEEWAYHGWPNADFSSRALEAFRAWRPERHGERTTQTDEELIAALTLPDDDEQSALLSPAEEVLLIDYRLFLGEVVADAIAYFARLVKRQLNDRLIVGVFYGYSLEITDPRAGHHDLRSLLREPSIDFFSSPNSYLGVRRPGIDWPFMSVAESIALHGKMLWMECDTRTFLTRPLREARPSICPPGKYEGGVWEGPATLQASLDLLLKNFGKCLTAGVGQWWFDMWGGWFADSAIMAMMAQFQRIGESSLNLPDRRLRAEIAVIVDEKAYAYLRPGTGLANAWTYLQRQGLGLMGAPYHIYDISDLVAASERNYKIYLFLNTMLVSPEFEQAAESIAGQGKCIIWTYSTAFVAKDIQACEQDKINRWTGFQLKRIDSSNHPHAVVEKHPEADRFFPNVPLEFNEYGLRMPIDPIWAVDDPEAVSLGRIQGTGDCGLAAKTSGGATRYFSSAPDLPSSLLRAIAYREGVHLYTDTDDVIYASASYLCIHASTPGLKTLYLNEPHEVHDAMNGELISRDAAEFTIHMKLHETRLFEIIPK
ncbi:hypothetical protein DFP98_13431 [Cohnella phaseoli]|uniref:Beta-galactosidase-like protein n=2 Tax=Cohnella phaseoli TaxID=456490 RepID=A0A3D9I9G6_9BACL|nr:hypothetical protein DFP98_13431 [Cohnella phaseoli]